MWVGTLDRIESPKQKVSIEDTTWTSKQTYPRRSGTLPDPTQPVSLLLSARNCNCRNERDQRRDGPRRVAPNYSFGNLLGLGRRGVDSIPFQSWPTHPSSLIPLLPRFFAARAVLHESDPWEKEEGIRSLVWPGEDGNAMSDSGGRSNTCDIKVSWRNSLEKFKIFIQTKGPYRLITIIGQVIT